MQLAIVGVGYVGLSTALCFAEIGHRVCCVDSDPNAYQALTQGRSPFYAPGLSDALARHLATGRLTVQNDLAQALRGAEAVFICVGTPSSENGGADLSQVRQVVFEIGAAAQDDLLIVDRSTVPAGTAEKIETELRSVLAKHHRSPHLLVASNPEFLVQGASFESLMRPDRVVLGADTPPALAKLLAIYEPWGLPPERLLIMDRRSAEMAKLAANAMLAARLSLINEIAEICEKAQVDTDAVCRAIGADPRIGSAYLAPGLGFGGPCLPKDVRALCAQARQNAVEPYLIESLLARNERQPELLFEKLARAFDGVLAQKVIALWGLSFKPGTDDIREASSLALIRRLLAAGATLRVFDPAAMPKAQELFKPQAQLHYCPEPYACCENADALVLLTEWPQFAKPDWAIVAASMRGRILLAGRKCWNPESVRAYGFRYLSLGH